MYSTLFKNACPHRSYALLNWSIFLIPIFFRVAVIATAFLIASNGRSDAPSGFVKIIWSTSPASFATFPPLIVLAYFDHASLEAWFIIQITHWAARLPVFLIAEPVSLESLHSLRSLRLPVPNRITFSEDSNPNWSIIWYPNDRSFQCAALYALNSI